MGRTYEVLSGQRIRKAAGAESLRSLPFPEMEVPVDVATPSPVNLVPMTGDDLPGDNHSVPFIEIGDRSKANEVSGPKLLAPRVLPQATSHEVGFQLLREAKATPVSGGELPANLIAYHQPTHPVSRQYRALVDGIVRQLPENGCSVLCFTPSVPGTVTSTLLLNLGITRSTDGEGRVLIVELVRGLQSSSAVLGMPQQPGLREVLSRTSPLTLTLNRTVIDHVWLMPAGKVDIGTEEMSRLGSVLDQLRARFDWILIEAPAWGTYPMREWMKACDGVYLVTRPDEWDSPQTEFAHQGIVESGGKLRGCVTTKE